MVKSENFIKNLIALPHKYEWLDFKESWIHPDDCQHRGSQLCARTNF